MQMTLRLCTKCGKSKLVDSFYKRKGKQGSLLNTCKNCTPPSSLVKYADTCEERKAAMREYYSQNKAVIQASRKLKRETDLNSKLKHMIRNALQRSKVKGFEFNLDFETVLKIFERQSGKCFYTGLDLELTGKNRVSIDRKDPSKGYTEDNVNLVCLQVNYMKRDISHEDFISFCKTVGGNF